jgi:hypothetical protein
MRKLILLFIAIILIANFFIFDGDWNDFYNWSQAVAEDIREK